MNVHELTRKQLVELKQAYLCNLNPNTSYGDLANADNLVRDEIIFDDYAGTDFMAEDFSLANSDALTVEVDGIDWDISDKAVMEKFGSLTNDNGLPYTAKDFDLPFSVVLQMSKARCDEIESGDEEGMDDYIADRLANEYTFCPANFTWQFIKANTPAEEEDDTMTKTKTAKKQTYTVHVTYTMVHEEKVEAKDAAEAVKKARDAFSNSADYSYDDFDDITAVEVVDVH